MCDFCSTLKYLLNQEVLKICIDKTLFQKFGYKVIHLNNYLKSLSVNLFSIFDGENVVLKLDNPNCGFTLLNVERS